MKFCDVKAIVTGGASGLGAAVVTQILNAGGRVAIMDLVTAIENATFIKNAKLSIKSGALLTVAADVTDDESVTSVIKTIYDDFKGINLVVNCAGILYGEKMLSTDHVMKSKDFERVIAINLFGTFRVCRTAADLMRHNDVIENECGVIINTASIAAFEGQIGQLAYSASKGGVVSMTLPMARELARHKIRVMTIAPGLFDTSMLSEFSDEIKHTIVEQTLHPHRLGYPIEFANTVQHIVENPMLNGSTIRLDGGLRLAAK